MLSSGNKKKRVKELLNSAYPNPKKCRVQEAGHEENNNNKKKRRKKNTLSRERRMRAKETQALVAENRDPKCERRVLIGDAVDAQLKACAGNAYMRQRELSRAKAASSSYSVSLFVLVIVCRGQFMYTPLLFLYFCRTSRRGRVTSLAIRF